MRDCDLYRQTTCGGEECYLSEGATPRAPQDSQRNTQTFQGMAADARRDKVRGLWRRPTHPFRRPERGRHARLPSDRG